MYISNGTYYNRVAKGLRQKETQKMQTKSFYFYFLFCFSLCLCFFLSLRRVANLNSALKAKATTTASIKLCVRTIKNLLELLFNIWFDMTIISPCVAKNCLHHWLLSSPLLPLRVFIVLLSLRVDSNFFFFWPAQPNSKWNSICSPCQQIFSVFLREWVYEVFCGSVRSSNGNHHQA